MKALYTFISGKELTLDCTEYKIGPLSSLALNPLFHGYDLAPQPPNTTITLEKSPQNVRN